MVGVRFKMAIDHRIPLQAQSFDMLGMLGRGSELAQFYTKQKTDNEMTRIYNESQGDLDKMLSVAPQSKMARWIMPQLQSQKAAQEKAMYDHLKTEAEISKIGSEAYKNNQQGGGYALDNSGKKLGAIQGAFQQASLTGDKAQVLLGLNGLVRTEMMTPEEYQHQAAIVNAMTPDELKQYAGGINFANAKDPAALQYQSADNAADNAQSDINNQRTTNASIYSTDVSAETADKNRVQNQQQFDVKAYIEQNEPLDYFTADDGTRYAVYAGGKGIPISNDKGGVIKAAPKAGQQLSATAQKELFEVEDSISAANNALVNLKDALKYSANAYDGVGAAQRAKLAGHVSDSEEAKNTVLLDNIVTGNALEMLKATFGGAPTEGERAILLQLQGSVNLPRNQREAIYTRAIEAAERRIKSNQTKAESIRSGSFFKSGQQTQSPSASDSASSAISAASSKYGI